MRIIKDIFYTDTQALDLYLPACDSFPLFIYFHGGGLEHGSKEAAELFADYLCNQGIAVLSANYRMFPEAKYPDFIEDAASAVAWACSHMAEYGKCTGYFIGGSSAGGYLSMMLCFDASYLAKHGIDAGKIGGFLHDAGQPTAHFNVLKYKGIDPRRIIIDETAPLYHIGTAKEYPPMCFLVSDHDMENRLEQTQLVLSTLRHFRYDESKIEMKLLHGTHCHYVAPPKDGSECPFGPLAAQFILKYCK